MPSHFIVTCWEDLLSKWCVKLWSKVAYYFSFSFSDSWQKYERGFSWGLPRLTLTPHTHILNANANTRSGAQMWGRGVSYTHSIWSAQIYTAARNSNMHPHRKGQSSYIEESFLCTVFHWKECCGNSPKTFLFSLPCKIIFEGIDYDYKKRIHWTQWEMSELVDYKYIHKIVLLQLKATKS